MPASRTPKASPSWAIPLGVIVVLLLAIAGYRAWKALSGSEPPAADTAKEIRPGMYDFRAEAQKGSLGRRSSEQGDTSKQSTGGPQ